MTGTSATLNWHAGDGRHIGYCMRCGGDIFNGPRHRCPREIGTEAAHLIMAAKQFVDAELALGMTSNGSRANFAARRHRDGLFAELVAAIRRHNEQTTVPQQEPTQ